MPSFFAEGVGDPGWGHEFPQNVQVLRNEGRDGLLCLSPARTQPPPAPTLLRRHGGSSPASFSPTCAKCTKPHFTSLHTAVNKITPHPHSHRSLFPPRSLPQSSPPGLSKSHSASLVFSFCSSCTLSPAFQGQEVLFKRCKIKPQQRMAG